MTPFASVDRLLVAMLGSSVSLTLLCLLMLVWVSTGATALRESFLAAASRRITALNGKPVTMSQSLAGQGRDVGRMLLPRHWLSLRSPVDDLVWARAVQRDATKAAGTWTDADLRVIVEFCRDQRGATATLEKVDRAARRHPVCDRAGAAAGYDELRTAERRYRRARRVLLREAVTSGAMWSVWKDLISSALDYLGRGAASGLLLAGASGTGLEPADLLTRVSTLSLVGGAIGSVLFVARLVRTLPVRGGPAGQWAHRHSYLTAVALPLAMTLLIGTAQLFGG